MKKIVLLLLVAAVAWHFWPEQKPRVKNFKNTGWKIVAFGNSLTYGKGASRQESYPAILERSLGRPVINMGRNGETAANAVVRIHEALEEKPYMVLIEFGGNDAIRSVPFSQTISAMEQMVDAVQKAGAVAVVEDTGGAGVMKKYSKAYKELARKKGAVFVPGILDGIMGKHNLMSDQIHPNAAGYKIVAKKIEDKIKPYL